MSDDLNATQPTHKASVRLAMRAEGAFWNAYLADHDTMAGAVLLGSIRMAAVQDKDRRFRFMALMQESFSAAFRDVGGGKMSWPDPPQAAPEHERSGSA